LSPFVDQCDQRGGDLADRVGPLCAPTDWLVVEKPDLRGSMVAGSPTVTATSGDVMLPVTFSFKGAEAKTAQMKQQGE
jgi:hypothetical protein